MRVPRRSARRSPRSSDRQNRLTIPRIAVDEAPVVIAAVDPRGRPEVEGFRRGAKHGRKDINGAPLAGPTRSPTPRGPRQPLPMPTMIGAQHTGFFRGAPSSPRGAAAAHRARSSRGSAARAGGANALRKTSRLTRGRPSSPPRATPSARSMRRMRSNGVGWATSVSATASSPRQSRRERAADSGTPTAARTRGRASRAVRKRRHRVRACAVAEAAKIDAASLQQSPSEAERSPGGRLETEPARAGPPPRRRRVSDLCPRTTRARLRLRVRREARC